LTLAQNDASSVQLGYLHIELVTADENYINEKSAQRDANTAPALAVVRFGHRPPPARHKHTNPQTGPITIHCWVTGWMAECLSLRR